MCLVEQGGVCLLWVDAFDLGGYARTSHTPSPSREGRLEMLFLIGNEWIGCEISPLERGNEVFVFYFEPVF